MKITNYVATFIAVSLTFYLLYIGQTFLIPLIVAIVLWYLINSLAHEFQKIPFFGHKIPYWFGLTASLITSGFFIYIFYVLITANINEIVETAPTYQIKLENLISRTYETLNIEGSTSINQIISEINIASYASTLASAVTSIASYTSLTIIYLIFMFIEYGTFETKLEKVTKSKKQYKELHKIFTHINKDIHQYLKVKFAVSLLTALFSYWVLIFFGVDLAAFWALLTFLFNFIPNIGSLIAVVFPMFISLIQFDTIYPFIAITLLLTTVQFVIGNIVEPKFMGKSLNLSPLVILLSIALWWHIWGIIGMFLCVPIMVITNIVLARFKQTRWIAIMLSNDGEVHKSV